MSKVPRNILTRLRLQRAGDTTFMKLTPENRTILKRLDPYITYGVPNVQTVRDLIEKFGYVHEGDKKVPIKDNAMIERHFVSKGIDDGSIICLEDMVHEIATGGPHFDEVIEYLYPLKLRGMIKYTKLPVLFSKGGTRGDRGTKINEFLSTFLG